MENLRTEFKKFVAIGTHPTLNHAVMEAFNAVNMTHAQVVVNEALNPAYTWRVMEL